VGWGVALRRGAGCLPCWLFAVGVRIARALVLLAGVLTLSMFFASVAELENRLWYYRLVVAQPELCRDAGRHLYFDTIFD
jgi:hypothetical protein